MPRNGESNSQPQARAIITYLSAYIFTSKCGTRASHIISPATDTSVTDSASHAKGLERLDDVVENAGIWTNKAEDNKLMVITHISTYLT